MHALRLNHKVKNEGIVIPFDKLKAFENKAVEIVITPYKDEIMENQDFEAKSKKKYTMRGRFNKYSNKDMLNLEKDAWEACIKEKHENC